MGPVDSRITFRPDGPTVILMAGLQGCASTEPKDGIHPLGDVVAESETAIYPEYGVPPDAVGRWGRRPALGSARTWRCATARG